MIHVEGNFNLFFENMYLYVVPFFRIYYTQSLKIKAPMETT